MTAAAALERAVREDGPSVLATLIGWLGGDFPLAEDALQDAYVSALTAWERDGVPRVPAAWLTTAARRRALDRLRRARGLEQRVAALAKLAGRETDEEDAMEDSALTDDRLRLLFTCCHPALALPARVALTVKSVGGLSTAQTAAAFLVPEATMQQRLLRARKKIVAAGIPYRVPPDDLLAERTNGVLATLYVVFTEGHTASTGAQLGRPDLATEAIRLTRLVTELLPAEPEADGLLALMLLTEARRPARTDAAGRSIGLGEQDRSRWDRAAIVEGTRRLECAFRLGRPGPYQLQAAIAALHAQAPSLDATDWPQIAALYGALHEATPTAVVAINHAVALGFAEGPAVGLARLESIDATSGLAAYAPYHAARADLLRRAGRAADADAAYAAAIAASANAVQRADLERRRATSAAADG